MAIFGFGQQDPYAEAEQAAQDRQTAFAGMKDNLPALGLIAGLSVLARNNGTRSVGQLIGQAGGDALNAYGTWRKMEDIKARQKQLDDIAKEEREYGRTQDAFKNDLALKQLGLQEAKMAQDMAMQRQRLGMAAAELALRRQNAMAGDWALSNGVLINKKTGELRQLTPEQLQQMQAAGVEPPKYSDVSKFMGDYKSATSDYDASGDALDTLRVGATQDNAFGDMEMIYALNKMYDPRSVVRGEEFKQMAMSGGLPTQVINFYNQVANGGRLTQEQKRQMVKIAYDLFEERSGKKKQYDEQYKTIAKPYGFNTDATVKDLHTETRNKARRFLGIDSSGPNDIIWNK